MTKNGISVVSFEANSSLQVAGVVAGDRLMAINSVPVNSIIDLNEVLKNYMPQTEVKVKIKSGTTEREISVKLN